MTQDTLLPFDLPAVKRKKVTADFGGGLISSDGGLVLLRGAERRLGLAEALAGCIREWRDPALVVHTLPAMLRFRMFAIACGYEDTDDCDALRTDPLFKLAVGRAPESGRALCSQPTMSRLENAPSRIEVARMTAALIDIFFRSFAVPPAAITLDIDDTCGPVHGHQQLSLFNAHYDTRCFLPVHVYHVESGKPVAVLLRPGKTPSGAEVRTLLKHLVRRIRRHWPRTRLTFRGDSHYGRTEAMAWCEDNGVDYIFGLAGNPVLHRLSYEVAEDLRVRRAEAGAEKMRCFAAFDYAAGSWNRERRVVARLEATARGFDARYIVTSLGGDPAPCARRAAEAGYAPLVTGDHGELARIVQSEQPALVLLDLMLPGVDGIELMRTVPELARPPAGHIHLGPRARRDRRPGVRGGRGRLHRQALLAYPVGGAGEGGAAPPRRSRAVAR